MQVSGKCPAQPHTPSSREIELIHSKWGRVHSDGGSWPPLLSQGVIRTRQVLSLTLSLCLHHQVTRPCSYSRKSHFDFEEEDVDKLEIR